MKRCTRTNKIVYRWLLPCIALCCGWLFAACANGSAEDPDAMQESVTTNGGAEEENIAATTLEKPSEDEAAEPPKTPLTLEEFFKLEKIAALTPREQETVLRLYDILESGDMTLVSLFIADMDENGQDDMVVMLRDVDEVDPYGNGCVYIYLNEEDPYRFYDEDWYYNFGVNVQWGDLTGDGRIELVLNTMGTGNGAVGDNYVAVISDTEEGLKELDFPPIPEEMGVKFSPGVRIEVYMEAKADTYSAYCPYLDESITFQSLNADPERYTLLTEPDCVGNNVRGFFWPQFTEYKDQNALMVAEYLSGEGGVVHCVGIAFFVLVWDEDGTSWIADWWIEPNEY